MIHAAILEHSTAAPAELAELNRVLIGAVDKAKAGEAATPAGVPFETPAGVKITRDVRTMPGWRPGYKPITRPLPKEQAQ